MTKKDYIKFAKTLNGQQPVKSDLETIDGFKMRVRQFNQIVTSIINVFSEDNTSFDSQRFKIAVYS